MSDEVWTQGTGIAERNSERLTLLRDGYHYSDEEPHRRVCGKEKCLFCTGGYGKRPRDREGWKDGPNVRAEAANG